MLGTMTTMLQIYPLFIGTTELLLIGGMALLLFGGKKLPEMMRGLGQGVKEFKKGMGEDKAATEENADELQNTTSCPNKSTENSFAEESAKPKDDAEVAERGEA